MERQAQMAPMPSCTVCGVTDVMRCAKCKTMYYCSPQHQQIDWPAHRQDCRRMAKEKSNNKMQQLQQAVAATTLSNNLPDAGNQSNLQQLQNGIEMETSVATDFLSSTNTSMMTIATTTTSVPPAISVVMGTNESEILNSQAESVSQQMQFRGGGEESVNPDIYFTQDAGQQQPQYPHISNHNNHLDKSSSYHIGNGSERVIGSANERRYEELCRNIINDLNEYGLSVVDDFLGMEKGLDILNEVHRMYAAGVFKDGQLVNNFLPEQDLRTIRGDKITWVKGVEPGCTMVGYLVNQVDAVICRANTMRNNGQLGDYNIKERTKAMVACYPGSGSHYVVHVDNPNKDGRVITAIYYLNVNWDAKRSGGVLRIFPEHGNTIADVEPKFDRLIFFWSDKRNPHEVQPAHRTRYAITVWYFDAYEREAALNRCKYNKSNEKAATIRKSTTNTQTAKKPLTTTTRAATNNSNINTSTHSNNSTNANTHTNTTASSTHAKAHLNKMANSNLNTNSNSANEICT